MLCIVKSATRECGCLCTCVSNGWWGRFKERQGEISLKQGDSTAHMQEDRCNKSEENLPLLDNCAEDCVFDTAGKERLCPLCLDHMSHNVHLNSVFT